MLNKSKAILAVAVFTLLWASAYAVPTLAHPFWVDEFDEDKPLRWEGEASECPYAYQHRHKNCENCPHDGEPGEGRRWNGGEEAQWRYGCRGSRLQGRINKRSISMGSTNGSGNRRGNS